MFPRTMLFFCYNVTKMRGQPVVDVFLKVFETKGEEWDKATIHSYIRKTAFENRDNEAPQKCGK